jgi:alpha-mannosidase
MAKGIIHVIAQAHIDMAWLWQFDPETIHGCCRPTFGLATENLEKFPEYYFSQSQIPLYQVTEKYYPKIFEKIAHFIKQGRWDVVGGMHNEFEGAEPCGESLVRQCVTGKRYFQQKFGLDITTGWQEDAWTHPWQLPQIFTKSGITSYMFKRGDLGERLFWWQAPDGSRVLTYKPLHIFRKIKAKEWLAYFKEMHAKYGISNVMIRIGKGDHGGGPFTKDITDILQLNKKFNPEIKVIFNSFDSYAAAVMNENPNLPVIKSELGHELTGDLTNCYELKKANRDMENLLITAEKAAMLASFFTTNEYPTEKLEIAWDRVLFNQFHDIIGGSGIPAVCEDAHRDYRQVKSIGSEILQNSLLSFLKIVDTSKYRMPIVVFNPLAWNRGGIVEIPLEIPYAEHKTQDEYVIADFSGIEKPIQFILEKNAEENHKDNQTVQGIFFWESVPGLGFTTLELIPKTQNKTLKNEHNPQSSLILISELNNEIILRNKYLEIHLNCLTGNISKLSLLSMNYDFIPAGHEMNQIILIEDRGDSEGRFKKGDDKLIRLDGKTVRLINALKTSIIEQGSVRVVIQSEYRYKSTIFIKKTIFYSELPQIYCELDVDWQETQLMVKIGFPFSISSPQITCDSAYCTVSRPMDGNDYSNQKWVDIASESSGFAVLNKGQYAYDCRDNELRINFLRSPTEPANNNEAGKHTLEYSIFPHKGSWKEAMCAQVGYEYNNPVISIGEKSHQGVLSPQFSMLNIDKPNIIIEVVKLAYDSTSIILRGCEYHGVETECAIIPMLNYIHIENAFETDLLEREIKEILLVDNKLSVIFKPHEIKTIKLVLSG